MLPCNRSKRNWFLLIYSRKVYGKTQHCTNAVRGAVATTQLMHWLIKASEKSSIYTLKKQGDSYISCTQLYRQVQEMDTDIFKHCCRHPPCGKCTSNLGAFGHNSKSDFGRGQEASLMQQCWHWELACGPLLTNQRWHMQLVSLMASAPAGFTEPPDHGFLSYLNVQDECSSHTSVPPDLQRQTLSHGAKNYFHYIHMIKASNLYLGALGIISHDTQLSFCHVEMHSAEITLPDWCVLCSSSKELLPCSLF